MQIHSNVKIRVRIETITYWFSRFFTMYNLKVISTYRNKEHQVYECTGYTQTNNTYT